MSNSKKLDNRIRYWYSIDKANKTIKAFVSNNDTYNIRGFDNDRYYASYSYLNKGRALVAIMDYINKHNLEDFKFIK